MKKNTCLMYDCFRIHLMDSVKKKLKDRNTVVALVPAGLTGQLQHLDISINPYIEEVRVLWSNWMAQEAIMNLLKVVG